MRQQQLIDTLLYSNRIIGNKHNKCKNTATEPQTVESRPLLSEPVQDRQCYPLILVLVLVLSLVLDLVHSLLAVAKGDQAAHAVE